MSRSRSTIVDPPVHPTDDTDPEESTLEFYFAEDVFHLQSSSLEEEEEEGEEEEEEEETISSADLIPALHTRSLGSVVCASQSHGRSVLLDQERKLRILPTESLPALLLLAAKLPDLGILSRVAAYTHVR